MTAVVGPVGDRARLPSRQRGRTAYEALRDLIIRGRLAPGARLVEMELASRLGVSRTPVREAMAHLVRDGLAAPAGSSARTQLAVTWLTQDDLHELYTIMGALEGAAARTVKSLTASERKRLATDMTTANRTFERVGRTRPRDFERLFHSHNAFHLVFIDRCAPRRLHRLIAQIRPQIDRYEYMYAGLVGPDYSASFAEHRAMVRTICCGPPDRAERAVRANWLNSAHRLSVAMSKLPPLGDVDERRRR